MSEPEKSPSSKFYWLFIVPIIVTIVGTFAASILWQKYCDQQPKSGILNPDNSQIVNSVSQTALLQNTSATTPVSQPINSETVQNSTSPNEITDTGSEAAIVNNPVNDSTIEEATIYIVNDGNHFSRLNDALKEKIEQSGLKVKYCFNDDFVNNTCFLHLLDGDPGEISFELNKYVDYLYVGEMFIDKVEENILPLGNAAAQLRIKLKKIDASTLQVVNQWHVTGAAAGTTKEIALASSMNKLVKNIVNP